MLPRWRCSIGFCAARSRLRLWTMYASQGLSLGQLVLVMLAGVAVGCALMYVVIKEAVWSALRSWDESHGRAPAKRGAPSTPSRSVTDDDSNG